ncbi:metal-dependent hydrolase [Helicobacter marmotae]|uniref:Dihydroorotase n=1 Tax=Helicobacter marmotae TaxID=152490 RepID=A0A3D8I443_9HELI|nr:metal-dependent hydrolase [Helicobacter marmotae]RDU59909.1 dihydroorotase [Helicobacter marmotae]
MLFKNATLCDYQGIREGDLRAENGVITQIGSLSAKNNEEVIDLQNKLLLPAMIDLNVSPKSLSLCVKNLLSLAQKALKGGIGSMLLYPHTTPACNESGTIELIKSLNAQSPIHLLPAISPINAEHKLIDVSTLHSSGGRAIFARSDMNAHTLISIAQYAQMLDIPLICFCQDKTLSEGVMNEGLLSASLGLPSIPAYSQTKEVAKIAEMLKDFPIKLIFDTLTYPRSLEILHHFKDSYPMQAAFFAQSSIHHLILNESLCEGYNTAAKINPPLVDETQRAQMLKDLEHNKIQLLTSLQCADFKSKKDQVFELASFGIDALEVYFSLLYTYLYKEHNIPLELISKLTSYMPAQILKLNKGALNEGKIAELIIVDPKAHFYFNDNFSPYNGHKLYAKVEALLSHQTLHYLP